MAQFTRDWNPRHLDAPLFEDLRRLHRDAIAAWMDQPQPDTLNQYLPPALSDWRFVASGSPMSAVDYELAIHREQRIPTRCNWHDFFNALIWLTFPLSKQAMNNAHVADIRKPGQQAGRSRRRDALTLLDEAGLVIVSTNPSIESLHRRHDWQTMFVVNRRQWSSQVRAFVVGHGLYEQCLSPYRGLTGKAWHMPVQTTFAFDANLSDQYQQIDQALARAIDTELTSPASLLPLPILGIPGWYADNANPEFYQDSGYFRPARSSNRTKNDRKASQSRSDSAR